MKILHWVGVRFKFNNACKILGRSIFSNFRLLPNVFDTVYPKLYSNYRMFDFYYENIHTTLCILDTNMTDGGECSQLKPIINKGCKNITRLARISHGIPLSSAYVEFDMKTAHLNPHTVFVSSLSFAHTHGIGPEGVERRECVILRHALIIHSAELTVAITCEPTPLCVSGFFFPRPKRRLECFICVARQYTRCCFVLGYITGAKEKQNIVLWLWCM
jgi:hypothetical protein